MPLLNENHFRCDTPGCDKDFAYDPGRPNQPPPVWDAATNSALERVIAVTHAKSGTVTWYCSDIHAIEAIGQGKHLPAAPPKVAPATDLDIKKAIAGAKAVENMKSKAKPS